MTEIRHGRRDFRVKRRSLFAKCDGANTNWGARLAKGEFPANNSLNTVKITAPVHGRSLRLRTLSGHPDGPQGPLAELGLPLTDSE